MGHQGSAAFMPRAPARRGADALCADASSLPVSDAPWRQVELWTLLARQMARLQPAWYRKRGLAGTAGQQRTPRKMLRGVGQNWEAAGAPRGVGRESGQDRRVEVLLRSIYLFFTVAKYT